MSAGQSIGTFQSSKMIPRTDINSSPGSGGRGRDRKNINQAASRARSVVANAWQSVREKIPTDVDWRKPVRQYPLASSLGALGIGALLGYSLGALSQKNARTGAADVQASRPGLTTRFRQTSAFDKLQHEAAVIGDRLVNELSSLANDVAVPALGGKLSGLFGSKPTSDPPTAPK